MKRSDVNYKARIYICGMTIADVAREISDDCFKITREQMSYVVHGKHLHEPKQSMIRDRLEAFLAQEEKRLGIEYET